MQPHFIPAYNRPSAAALAAGLAAECLPAAPHACCPCCHRKSAPLCVDRSPTCLAPACSLQPVKETQQKQRLLWRDLILRYCRHHRIHVVPAGEGDDLPLFHNAAINRKALLRLHLRLARGWAAGCGGGACVAQRTQQRGCVAAGCRLRPPPRSALRLIMLRLSYPRHGRQADTRCHAPAHPCAPCILPSPDTKPSAGRLTRDMKVLLLDDLVKAGSALWFDKAQRAALVLWRSVSEWADAIYGWARANGLQDSVVTVEEMQASAAGRARGTACCCSTAFGRWRGGAPGALCPPGAWPGAAPGALLGARQPACSLFPAALPPGPWLLQSGVYVAGTELEGLHREVLVRAVKHLEQQGRAKLFKGAAGDDEGVKFFA